MGLVLDGIVTLVVAFILAGQQFPYFVLFSFIILWQCRDELFPIEIQNREQLVKWLLTKLRDRVSNFKKRKSRSIDIENENYYEEIQSNAVVDYGPQEKLERKEFNEKMEETIKGLPREMRIVYNLKVKKGFCVLFFSRSVVLFNHY